MKANVKAVVAIEDKRILLMLHNRDEQALKELAERYGARCRIVARNILGNHEDAEECVNDALLKIWNSIPPAAPDDLGAYLLKAVRNTALDRLKSRMREKHGAGVPHASIDELAELLPAADTVESELDRRELLAAITRFLQSLPEKQRSIFVRRYWHFASFQTLAQDFDMTENHVQVTLSRLRKRLHDFLRKEGLL